MSATRTGATGDSHLPDDVATGALDTTAAAITTTAELALLLRWLRRRNARRCNSSELTYRELAIRTGWSRAAVGEYFTGRALPPTDRFDELVRLLGASPQEAGRFATARDRVEEQRRTSLTSSTSPTGVGEGRAAPEQLPADVPGFTGRADQITALNDLLDAEAAGSAPIIAAICGTAGIGKTTLAVHWAHQVRHRFPDGQLYVNLRGFDPGGSVMDAAEAVRGFLDALGVTPARIPPGVDAQAALYRSLAAGRRMLIVADNARTADQVRPLLPGTPGCLVVVTSRNQLSGLVADGAHPLMLGLLTPDEARHLLSRRLGETRTASEPCAVGEIIARCARLPLALAIVAARAASHPRFPLAVMAAELRDSAARLDAMSTGDTRADVRAVFSWSYQALDADAARVFRLLGLHPGPDISELAAASLTGLPLREVRGLLVRLARAHLVTEQVPGRYGFHDLLRAYAAELVGSTDTDQDRDAALDRMLDHYLHSANAADRFLDPHRDPIALIATGPGVRPETPEDHGSAEAWFATEHPVLLSAVEIAFNAGRDVHAWQLSWVIATFLRRDGHWNDWRAAHDAGLAAAERGNDSLGMALAHRGLARIDTWSGRYHDASHHLRQALTLYEELRDGTGQAHIHTSLGVLASRERRYHDALGHYRLAFDMFRDARHRVGQSIASNNMGWVHALQGNHQEALNCCRLALTLQQEIGDSDGEASTWDSLGYIEHQLEHHDRAVECFNHAVRLFREIGDRYNEADILIHLGDTHYANGQPGSAAAAWEHAVTILDHLEHPDTDQIRERIQRLQRSN